MLRTIALALPAVLAFAGVAEAHPGGAHSHAFASGFAHPLGGLDHILAMVAVGLWAGLAGGRAVWLWPAGFVGAMALGGALGMAGMPMPFVEQGILASIIVLGLAAALAVRPGLVAGLAIAAIAGLVHGHAHGTELPANASGLAYAAGFTLATALLHAAGIALTVAAARFAMPLAVRTAGGLTALAGVVLAAKLF